MKISVLMNTFNRAHWLRGCLESILAQDADFELIVRDNGSTDGGATWSVIQEFAQRDPRVKASRVEHNVRGLDHFVDQASGDYLTFFCDDDLMLPGSLQARADYLDTHPHAGLVYTSVLGMTETEEPLGKLYKTFGEDRDLGASFSSQFPGCTMPFPSVMVRREILERAWPELLSIGAGGASDWALWLCCLKHTTAAFLEAPCAILRQHDGQDARGMVRSGECATDHYKVWAHFIDQGHKPVPEDGRVWASQAEVAGISLEEFMGLCATTARASRIHLTMIVKNEGHVLARCLASVRPHLSSYTIVDTGSTDDTIEVAHRALAGLPGQVQRVQWIDYATNRNAAMVLAHRIPDWDYALVIDADEILREFPAPMDLTADVYRCPVEYCGDVAPRVLLVKRGYPGCWVDAIHEELCAWGTWEALPGASILSFPDGARAFDPERANNDLRAIFSELEKNPKPKWYYYLGMTYFNAGDLDQAKKALELRLSFAEGDPQEITRARETLAAIAAQEASCVS